jgi:HAMP domain-containing protein
MKSKGIVILIPVLIAAVVAGVMLLFSANWVQVAMAVIPVALILYVAVSQLSAKFIRPISYLATQTRRIVGDKLTEGDLSRLVVIPKEGEFGEIASDVNYLVRELRIANERDNQFHALEASAAREKSKSDELRLSYDNLLVVSELGQQIISSLRLEDIASTAYETLNTMMDAASLEHATIDSPKKS